jgi:hypothetical protein
MRNLISAAILAAGLSIGGCASIESRPEVRLEQRIEKIPIQYKDYSKLSLEEAGKDRMQIPLFLGEYFREDRKKQNKRIENGGFFNEILEQAEKNGFDSDKLRGCSAKELIDLSIKLVCDNLKYEEVDEDPKYEPGVTGLDTYFNDKTGDCDKYANLFTVVFNFLKNRNDNCSNVYVTGAANYLNPKEHAWSTVWVRAKDGVIASFIDLTFYDAKGVLELDKRWFDRREMLDDVLLKSHLYGEIDSLSELLPYLNERIKKLEENEGEGQLLARYYASKTYIYSYAAMYNPQYHKEVRELFDKFKEKGFSKFNIEYLRMLYYAGQSDIAEEKAEDAKERINLMKEINPKHIMTKDIEDRL